MSVGHAEDVRLIGEGALAALAAPAVRARPAIAEAAAAAIPIRAIRLRRFMTGPFVLGNSGGDNQLSAGAPEFRRRAPSWAAGTSQGTGSASRDGSRDNPLTRYGTAGTGPGQAAPGTGRRDAGPSRRPGVIPGMRAARRIPHRLTADRSPGG